MGRGKLRSLRVLVWTRTSPTRPTNRSRIEDPHQVPVNHFHRRATGRQPMPTEYRRTEEVTLHKLRLNRAPFLQATRHRHGQVDDPSCPYCNNGEEHILRVEDDPWRRLETRRPTNIYTRRHGLFEEHWGSTPWAQHCRRPTTTLQVELRLSNTVSNI